MPGDVIRGTKVEGRHETTQCFLAVIIDYGSSNRLAYFRFAVPSLDAGDDLAIVLSFIDKAA